MDKTSPTLMDLVGACGLPQVPQCGLTVKKARVTTFKSSKSSRDGCIRPYISGSYGLSRFDSYRSPIEVYTASKLVQGGYTHMISYHVGIIWV